jgi:AcrR family transcriptional regulator
MGQEEVRGEGGKSKDMNARRTKKEEKIHKILTTTVSLLAKKGYENTTINDIADASGISRGLLHYYFKDKEDLVAEALTFGFGSMWDRSLGEIQSARTPTQLVDTMIEVLKKNVKKDPDFSALLFEMWVSGRRSTKIRKVFNEGFEEAIGRLKGLFEFASSIGIIKINKDESEGVIRLLLALYHGLAIQMLANTRIIDDNRLWIPIRRVLLSSLENKSE